jgi:hypothetical protein
MLGFESGRVTMIDTKQIQMRLTPQTLTKIARLQDNAHLKSKADAVRLGVELALMITDAIRDGKKIMIESSNGSAVQLVVPQMQM